MKLFVLDELYAVVRCDPDAPLPNWATGGHFWSVTRSDSELSIVCREDDVPEDASAERGWCALELAGPLDTSAAPSRPSRRRGTRSTVDARRRYAYAPRNDSRLPHLVGLALRAGRERALS